MAELVLNESFPIETLIMCPAVSSVLNNIEILFY